MSNSKAFIYSRNGVKDGKHAYATARLLSMLVVLIVCGPVAFAETGTNTEVVALESLFRDGVNSLTYTSRFAQAITPEALEEVLDTIRGRVGGFVTVEGDANPYTVRFTDGNATVHIAIAPDGAVAGLQFTQVVESGSSLDEAVALFMELPGEASIVVRKNGQPIISERGDTVLAVGSSFKLAVLRAVEAVLDEGRLQWDTVLTLDERDISLPSGVLQSWPVGSPITVGTAAVLMISGSDNTATDLLIRTIGRESVEQFAPDSRPLLTTREFFLLKADDQSDARAVFLRGSGDERRQVLSNLQGELPSPSLFESGPVHQEIEWFFTTAQLAELIEQVDRSDILGVNPGPIEPSHWAEYGYKGGSEPGVLNMTLLLVASDGDRFSLSATQNRSDGDIDAGAFVEVLQAVISHLK